MNGAMIEAEDKLNIESNVVQFQLRLCQGFQSG
jgi:hypothetical protein